MTAVPGKEKPRPSAKPAPKPSPKPSWLRSIGFGLMLAIWWVVTVEIPAWNLFRIVANRGVERQYAPITLWAFDQSMQWQHYRGLVIVLILLAVGLNYWLWYRLTRYDAWGRWLFKAGFLVVYIIMYGYFIAIFIGAELPVYTIPPTLQALPE